MKRLAVGISALCVLALLASGASASSSNATGFANLGRLPLAFVENKGQVDERAKFVIRGPNGSCFFTRDSIVYSLWKANGRAEALWVKLVDVDPQVKLEGQGKLEGKVNYLIGRDDSKWKRDISTYSGVVYRGAWEGIDVIYRGEGERLKYDIRISPGADIGKIQLEYQGAKKLSLTSDGDLVIDTPVASFTEQKPKVYQEIDGKKVWIEGNYTLIGKSVGFSIENSDPAYPIVIDPASDLSWSTFLGGGYYDYARDVALDAYGCVYVTGTTRSTDFPTTVGAFDTTGAADDAFITKLSADGNSLVYSTFLGGAAAVGTTIAALAADDGQAIAVDAGGCAYVVGSTPCADFPTTPGALCTTQTVLSTVPPTAFVTKLDPSGGSLVYSTFLPNAGISSIAVDTAGCAYLTGSAAITLRTTPGAVQTVSGGGIDGFVAKLDPNGATLVYSTFLGGSGYDYGTGIAVDPGGSAYVTGNTYSTNFPTTPGAFDTTTNGGDAFAAKLDPQGSTLVYSTFIGGSGDDIARDLAVDLDGSVYVTGSTDSVDFPITTASFGARYNGLTDCFVTRLNPQGSGLLYSAYLGGGSCDIGRGVAVDFSGNAYVVGDTSSHDFPVVRGSLKDRFGGLSDGFLAKISPSGVKLSYSTFLGGSEEDSAAAVAVGLDGRACVAGETWSADFPLTPTAADTTCVAGEAFVAKLDIPPAILSIDCSPAGMGVTTPAPGAYVYLAGVTVPISVTASSGYVFDHWTGGVANPTSPTTSVLLDEPKAVTALLLPSLLRAKLWPDHAPFAGVSCVVTAAFPDFLYIETEDRTTGIMVIKPAHGLAVGMRADVTGTVMTSQNGERCIAASTAIQNGTGEVSPLSLTNRALGGGDWHFDPATLAGQRGITGADGLNNIGLLVKLCGKVVSVGNSRFVIDDGSKVFPEMEVPAGVSMPAVNDYVAVTGISSCRSTYPNTYRMVRVRDQSDIVVLLSGATIGGRVTQSGVESVDRTIEPPPGYPADYTNSWTIAGPAGTKRIRVHFSLYEMRDDLIFVRDSSGIARQVLRFADPPVSELWTDWIATNTLTLDFRAASAFESGYGFRVDRYELDLVNSPLAGVTVTLDSGILPAVTGADGAYSFGNLTPGDYTVAPSLAGFTFTPPSRSVSLVEGQYKLGMDFERN